jgi:uncharacterized protein (DUF1800 family)
MQRLQQQAKRGLNENYARELMELHTLGVDGGYTQKDVQEVARALRDGPSIAVGEFLFNPAITTPARRRFLERNSGRRGVQEGEEVLDMVARAPATALHHDEARAPFRERRSTEGACRSMRHTFSNSDGDIRETLRASSRRPSSSVVKRIARR